MKYVNLVGLLLIFSCAGMNKTRPGYSRSELKANIENLKGKSITEVKKILGEPVAEGACKENNYSLVYLSKPTSNINFALDMANKKGNLKCSVVSLWKNKEGKYIHPNYVSIMEMTNCDNYSIPYTRKCAKVK